MAQHEKKRRRSESNQWDYRIHDGPAEFRFDLEGMLTSRDVAELEQCWRTAASTINGKALVVDLSGLTGIDDHGRQLLHLWREAGAKFVANSQAAQAITESVTGEPILCDSQARTAGLGWLSVQSALRISVALLALLLLASVWADSGRAVVAQRAEVAATHK